MRLIMVMIFLLSPLAAMGQKSDNYGIFSYVINSQGNTCSGSGKMILGSTGEAFTSRSYGNRHAIQSGLFNEHFVLPPTRTPTPTATVTATPRVDPEGFDGRIISKKTCYAYPNPSRGHVTKFRVYTKESARVEFKVYTLQHKFVWSTVIDYSQIGYNELRWNNANMPNGGYFMLVKAKGHESGREERVIKPFAIIK